MFPYLNLFGFQMPMYSIMIGLGLILGVLLAVFRAKRSGLKGEDVFNACLFAVIGLIVGGKILYLITIIPWMAENWSRLMSTPQLWIDLLRGGFVFYGGLIGALLMIGWYVKKFRIPAMQMLDTLMPSVPLAHAFGRIGCFCAGCCYGIPSPFGFDFSASEVAPHGVTLLPVQLFEAGGNLLLCGILLLVGRRMKKPGLLTGIYLAGYAVMRFVLEFFRYDAERGGFLGVSTSQWISLLLLPVGVFIIWRAVYPKTNSEQG